ncbi:MAG: ABC transporter permease [Clostridiales bacterium]|nr:ABC transporter permease [Clostridiales bacterium]
MRAYKSIFKLRLINSLQYRTSAIAGILTQIAFGLMYIMLFRAFYSQGNIPENFTLNQMSSYIWLQQMFFVLLYIGEKNRPIVSQIEQGNISYELVRPLNLYGNWYFTLYAQKLSSALLRFFPVLLFSILLPAGWGLSFPASFPALILFIINLIVGSLLAVAINMLCYCLLFNTMSSIGIFSILNTLAVLFNGSLIPIPLMPNWFQSIVNFLPFRYVNDLAFRTYVNSIPLNEALIQTAIQFAWLVLIILIGNLWMKKNLKKVEVQGG